MKLEKYRFDGSEKIDLKKIRYDFDEIKKKKSALVKQTKKNMEEVAELQDRLYAEGREAILICLQALDAAGKDSVVKHVFSSINPQGIEVHSFKSPKTRTKPRTIFCGVITSDFLRAAKCAFSIVRITKKF